MEQNNFDKQYRDALAGKLREKRSSGNMDEAQEMLAEQHGTMLYEGAKKAHQEGDQLETRNLSIEKKIAQLEALKEKINGAKENIDQAISIETPTEEDPVLAELRKDEKNIFGLLKEIAQEGKTNSPEWDAAQIAWRETVKKIEVHERENNPEVLQDKETAKAGFDKKNEDISEQETTLQSEANLNQTSEDGVVKAEEELRQDSKEQVVTQEDADKNVENQSKVDDVLENFDAIRADREREVMKSTLNASIDSAKKSLVWMTGKDPKNINDQLEAGKKIKNNRSWSTPSMVMREFRKLRQAEKQLKNLDQMFAGNEILEVNPTEAKEKGADRPYSEWSNEELQKAYSDSRQKEFIAGDQASGDHKRLNSLMAAALVERGLMSPLEAHESMEKPTAMAAMAAAELRNEDLKSKDENKKRFGGAWFKKNWKWLAGAGLVGLLLFGPKSCEKAKVADTVGGNTIEKVDNRSVEDEYSYCEIEKGDGQTQVMKRILESDTNLMKQSGLSDLSPESMKTLGERLKVIDEQGNEIRLKGATIGGKIGLRFLEDGTPVMKLHLNPDDIDAESMIRYESTGDATYQGQVEGEYTTTKDGKIINDGETANYTDFLKPNK